ncbi:MAG: hypothetical protein KJ646_02290 [Nanoarchaeota archaeon]|nr:hypothetical protein [Nanoarchaeota archaeon]MBU4116414.1 hypothetical protein [Nanoarchaeota archaeon]
MLSLFGKKKELEPVTPKQRYPCPFYGFHMAMEMLMDQSGNQCALITKSYSPCKMKISNQTPNWNKCQFVGEKNRKALETITDNFIIFPDEFFPKGAKSWKGMAFKDWQNYIMKQETSPK